jgi:hypothetical protein
VNTAARVGLGAAQPVYDGAVSRNDLRWPHLAILLPGIGMAWVGWLSRREQAHREELLQALRIQGLALAVLLLHGVLHLGVLGVSAMNANTPQAPGSSLPELIDRMLAGIGWLNAMAGLGEWGLLALFGVAASFGRPYPGLGALSTGGPS